MTLKEAQNYAPSFLHVPGDGTRWECEKCKNYFLASEVVKPFTVDRKVNYVTCFGCLGEWIKTAIDCGEFEEDVF